MLAVSSLQVRKLVSLDCSEDPIWAQQLLEQLAPQLEEVQVNSANYFYVSVN